jgi:hypothetical protein
MRPMPNMKWPACEDTLLCVFGGGGVQQAAGGWGHVAASDHASHVAFHAAVQRSVQPQYAIVSRCCIGG